MVRQHSSFFLVLDLLLNDSRVWTEQSATNTDWNHFLSPSWFADNVQYLYWQYVHNAISAHILFSSRSFVGFDDKSWKSWIGVDRLGKSCCMIESWRHVSGRDLAKGGGQRGNRTSDTRIFNGVLQIFWLRFSRLNYKNSSVLQSVRRAKTKIRSWHTSRRVDYVLLVLLCQSSCAWRTRIMKIVPFCSTL